MHNTLILLLSIVVWDIKLAQAACGPLINLIAQYPPVISYCSSRFPLAPTTTTISYTNGTTTTVSGPAATITVATVTATATAEAATNTNTVTAVNVVTVTQTGTAISTTTDVSTTTETKTVTATVATGTSTVTRAPNAKRDNGAGNEQESAYRSFTSQSRTRIASACSSCILTRSTVTTSTTSTTTVTITTIPTSTVTATSAVTNYPTITATDTATVLSTTTATVNITSTVTTNSATTVTTTITTTTNVQATVTVAPSFKGPSCNNGTDSSNKGVGGCSENCFCDLRKGQTQVGVCNPSTGCGRPCQTDLDCGRNEACAVGPYFARCPGRSSCVRYTACSSTYVAKRDVMVKDVGLWTGRMKRSAFAGPKRDMKRGPDGAVV